MISEALRTELLKMRGIIELAVPSLPDDKASEAPKLFPRMKCGGGLIAAGTRICWNGIVKKAAVDLWDREENNPDNAPALWADIGYRDGIRIIPAVITTTLAFAENELGWWGDALYRSKVSANVYTPEQYPANWEKVEHAD